MCEPKLKKRSRHPKKIREMAMQTDFFDISGKKIQLFSFSKTEQQQMEEVFPTYNLNQDPFGESQ